MPYSTCCGAYTNMEEIDICPDCLEHCSWEEQDEPTDDQTFNNHNTEGGISFNNNSTWQGR